VVTDVVSWLTRRHRTTPDSLADGREARPAAHSGNDEHLDLTGSGKGRKPGVLSRTPSRRIEGSSAPASRQASACDGSLRRVARSPTDDQAGDQPYTPVTQTVRGLLTATHTGSHAIAAIAWSVGIAIVSYFWAVRLYNRRRAAGPK